MEISKPNSQSALVSLSIPSPRARIRPVTAQPEPLVRREEKRRSLPFRKADIARAVSAVAKAGFVAGSIEVAKDGTIRIYAAGAEPTASLFDQWADKL